MKTPFVRLRCGSTEATLLPGDIIGRGWSAQLSIDDGRISEAHALVSLRGGQLKLLGLRGRFVIGGEATAEAVLYRGQQIDLAPTIRCDVVDLALPTLILGLRSDNLPLTTLLGACHLREPDSAQLVPGFNIHAAVNFWNREAQWRAKARGQTFNVVPGRPIYVGATQLEVVASPLASAQADVTVLDRHTRPPLRLVVHHDTVTIEVPGRPHTHFGGIPARILNELVEFDGPANWELIAREIWADADTAETQLRHRWDVALFRLRNRLKRGGVPANIVSADGSGNFELLLSAEDMVEARG